MEEHILTFVKTKQKPYQYWQIKKTLCGEVISAFTWLLLDYEPAVLYVFRKVEKLDGGTFCTFHGRSVTCPDHVQGKAQAEEDEARMAGRSGPSAGRWHAAGNLNLGNDEGRERDMRRQSRAVGVDKGFDLLCFFIAGLNLEEENQILLI